MKKENDLVYLVKAERNTYRVYFENGVFMGDVVQSEDGFYNFWPESSTGGYWASHVLRAIADKLDELNKPWQDQIDNDPALGGAGKK